TEQLAENSLKNVRTELIGAEPGRERVERVEEQDAGRGPSRLLENLAQRALGFTQPLRVELRAVDGDQRNLLLARERSRQCGLAGARRSYQQNAARRSQSDLLVDFVAHVRVLDDGIEHSLDLVQASERGKRRRAFLDKELAGGAGFDFFQAGEKVFARDAQCSEFRRRNSVGLKGRVGEEPSQSNHADFLSERFQIGADETMRMLGDLAQVDIGRERHGASVNAENLQARLRVRNADFDFAIETAGTPQRRI